MTEAELREVHHRIVKVLTFANKMRIRSHELRDILMVKLAIEWVLQMETTNGKAWEATLFRGINNLEGLRESYERSVKAASN